MTDSWLQDLRGDAQRLISTADPRVFTEVTAARRSRVPRASKPLVAFTRDNPERHPANTPVTPPGSATLFWAPRGSGLVPMLHTAFVSDDFTGVAELWPALVESHRQRSVATVEDAIGSLLGAPSFFELRFRTKTLASYVWLDGTLELGSLTMPYTGDLLDAGEFAVVEFVRFDERTRERRLRSVDPGPAWDTLVVVNEPILSDLERRVLRAVPVEQTEMFIASPGDVACTPAALLVIAVFVAINTTVTCCCSMRDLLSEVSYPLDTLMQTSTELAASELIELRAEIFDQVGIL